MPELLVVIAIVGLAAVVAIPLVSHTIRSAGIRVATGQFAADLRAVRMIAVSTRRTASVHVAPAPDNFYAYTDTRGRERRVSMPDGIRIVASTSPIRFEPNGSVPGGATTVFQASTDGPIEQWTVTMNALGVPKTTYARVE